MRTNLAELRDGRPYKSNNLTDAQISKVVKLKRQWKVSSTMLGKRFGVSKEVINRVLAHRGVDTRKEELCRRLRGTI